MMKRISGTNFLIFSILSVFLLEILFYRYQEMFYNYGFSAKNLFEGKWWTLISSIFLHASPEHLTMNVIALFFFGNAIEEKLGTKKMLFIFFFSSFVGELFILTLSFIGLYPFDIPTVGASGGIFGLMGAAMVVKPFEFIMYPYLIPLPLFLIAIIYTLSNFLYFIYYTFSGGSTEISYAAHLGGVIAGIYIGFKERRDKKAILILMFLISIILFPFIFTIIQILESFNYLSLLYR